MRLCQYILADSLAEARDKAPWAVVIKECGVNLYGCFRSHFAYGKWLEKTKIQINHEGNSPSTLTLQ